MVSWSTLLDRLELLGNKIAVYTCMNMCCIDISTSRHTGTWPMHDCMCLLCYYIVLAMSEKASLDSKWPIYIAWCDFHEQFLSTLSLKCPTIVYSCCIPRMSVVYLDKHICGVHLFFFGNSRRLPELSEPIKWTLSSVTLSKDLPWSAYIVTQTLTNFWLFMSVGSTFADWEGYKVTTEDIKVIYWGWGLIRYSYKAKGVARDMMYIYWIA